MSAHVAFTSAMDGTAPVVGAKPRYAAVVASGGETAQGLRDGEIVIVTALANCYVAFGQTGITASASNGFYLPQNTTMSFGRVGASDVVAVTNA